MMFFTKKEVYWVSCGILALVISLSWNAAIFAQDSSIYGVKSTEPKATYTGVDTCKNCHPEEYKDFLDRNFNLAWNVLKMRGDHDNPRCLKCHTTGYGRPGGFVSEAKTPELANKQCEACHGPGSNHAGNPGNASHRKKLKISEAAHNNCIDCHLCMDAHKDVNF